MTLAVRPNLDSITSYVLLKQETWFENELPFLMQYLQPGMTAIDVGANAGVYSLPMARAVGPTGRVFAGGRRFFAEHSPLVMFEVRSGDKVNHRLGKTVEDLGYRCFRLAARFAIAGAADAGNARWFRPNFAATPPAI